MKLNRHVDTFLVFSLAPISVLFLSFFNIKVLEPQLLPFKEMIFMFFFIPFVEEIVFRWGVQDSIQKLCHYKKYYLSSSNVLTAILFSIGHMFYQPIPWALSVFFPALVFGFIYERKGNIVYPIVFHSFYNFVFFTFLH